MNSLSKNRKGEFTPVLTLYLRNLPSRPRSTQNFIRVLLKSINPTNTFVLNPALPIPKPKLANNTRQQDKNEGQQQSQQLLDSEYGILEISKSRSSKLKNQCFVTFSDVASASNFKKSFEGKLKTNGRLIDIQYSRHDSLLALSQDETKAGILKKVLKTRAKKKLLRNDPIVSREHNLKRQLRRLRSKLRRKNIDNEDILKIVSQVRKEKERNLAKMASITSSRGTSTGTGKMRKKKVTSTKTNESIEQSRKSNPPNKILLVQNLPDGTTEPQLAELFGGKGLLEIRLVNVRSLAFIDYDTVENAANVRQRLGDTYSWNGNLLSINFAK